MKNLFCILLFSCIFSVSAQELSCTVSINTSTLQTGTSADQQVFSDMKTSITDFMNNHRWTTDIYSTEEKIKCNLVINLMKATDQYVYQSSLQFQVFRPVYGTTYETMILNHVDKNFSFSFRNEDRQMIFNENNFSNALTSTLGFYSLLAVGLDYDSFSKLGGTQYLQRGVNVVNLEASAYNMMSDVCKSDPRSKFCVASNILTAQLLPFREGLYSYHRQGLDLLTTDPTTGRKNALGIINTMKQLQGARQNIGIFDGFLDAKADELVNVFSESTVEEKKKVFGILSQLDPAKTEKYRKLIQ